MTAAYLLKGKGFDATVFEGSERLGGNVQTVSRDGYTFEEGPNSLLKSPRLVDLVRLLKLEDEVLASDKAAKKRYVLFDGKLEAMGPRSFINGYFSLKTLAALISEPFVRSKSPEGESVADFMSRRIGPELVEKALDPFVSGIYAGDPNDLSMRAAFPKLFEMERDHGSLIVAAFRRKTEKTDANFPRTFSFRGGLKTLISALAKGIGDGIRLSTPVDEIEPAGLQYNINGDTYDAVVISTPAFIASKLIETRDIALADRLNEVRYPQLAVVILGFKSESIEAKLDAFGFLIASREKRSILGTVFHSIVFPERSPEGHRLLVTFVGGVRSGDSLDAKTDDELKTLVHAELTEILGVNGEPDFVHVKRWTKAIPQYRIGYEEITEACGSFEKNNPGIYFCSNFYRGISMGDCVKNAFDTADSAAKYLNSK